ncbi:istB-like ATP binding family protein, partial [Escherichia coli 8.0586]
MTTARYGQPSSVRKY